MKRIISLISALTMLTAVPMSASATDYGLNSYEISIVDTILADLSSYDFNADGKTDFYDTELLLTVYACKQLGNIEINMDKTYTVLADGFFNHMTEEELARVIATGNVTNPEWELPATEDDNEDNINALDAAYIKTAIAMYYGAGDTNADGAVDSLDASAVLKHYALDQAEDSCEYGSELYEECNEYFRSIERESVFSFGDYNGDGAINALDASEIMADYAAAQTA